MQGMCCNRSDSHALKRQRKHAGFLRVFYFVIIACTNEKISLACYETRYVTLCLWHNTQSELSNLELEW
jgi:hypothetical protein